MGKYVELWERYYVVPTDVQAVADAAVRAVISDGVAYILTKWNDGVKSIILDPESVHYILSQDKTLKTDLEAMESAGFHL